MRWERRRSVCTPAPCNSGIYFVIYILKRGTVKFPGSIPFHERTPHETFHIKENVLFRNGGLPGLIGKSFFLFLSSRLLIGYILVRLFA